MNYFVFRSFCTIFVAEKLTIRLYRHEHSTSHPKQDIQEDEMVRIDRLKNARFSVDEPMQIGWEEGAGRVFADKIVFALLTINRSATFERMELFERAYEKLVQMKKETE